MIRIRNLAGALTACVVLTGCAALRGPDPVTVGEILDMTRAGVPAPEIVDDIQRSGTVYRLSASELADLRQQGVADPVIDEMQRSYLDAVAQDRAFEDWGPYSMGPDGFWYGGYPYGWGGWGPGWGGPGWVAPARRR